MLGSTAAAALLGLALAAGGGAKATRTVKLAVGDTFTSTKTHIVCSVRLGSTLLPGQKQLVCDYVDTRRPLDNTYSVVVAANGEALIAKTRLLGAPTVVIRRKPALARHRAASYRLVKGDIVTVTGTRIECLISGPAVVCFQFDAARRQAVPGSFGVDIGDDHAALFHLDAKGKIKVLKLLRQPR